MNASTPSITESAAAYVSGLFSLHLDDRYSYHNIAHTEDVAAAVQEIGEASGLNHEELEIVLLAAWFHDSGITAEYAPHEKISCDLAANFLAKHSYGPAEIEAVQKCILATDIRTTPNTLMEQVICDADLLHLGRKDFWENSEALRHEWQLILHQDYSDAEWYRKQIAFMTEREFYTNYVRENYQSIKEHNIDKLHKKLRKLDGSEASADEPQRKKKKKSKDDNSLEGKGMLGKGDRGVETMFRITSRNHVEFSSMVDSKANIMISINTLVISVVISVLFRKLDTNTYMTIPTFVFLAVCLMTIVFAVLASRPKVTSGVFTPEDITKKRANLLFFGNFYRVPVEEFEWGMREMLKDRDYLYDSMIRDFYFLGQVLGKKYHYLRISYNIFMYGFVLSILLYVIMFLVFAEAPVEIVPL